MVEDISILKKYQHFAIMGGTFDPIHYGHLAVAECVRCAFHLDKVFFIPSGKPPHKDCSKVTNNEHRLEMTRLAIESNPYFEVSSIEIDRPGRTYTIDTVKELQEILGKESNFYFITGADAIHELPTWKNYEELLGLCKFIAVTRPGYQKETLLKDIGDLRDTFESKIHFFEVPALDISSSDLRFRIAHGMPIKYLLPEAVEEYIFKEGLYQGQEEW